MKLSNLETAENPKAYLRLSRNSSPFEGFPRPHTPANLDSDASRDTLAGPRHPFRLRSRPQHRTPTLAGPSGANVARAFRLGKHLLEEILRAARVQQREHRDAHVLLHGSAELAPREGEDDWHAVVVALVL